MPRHTLVCTSFLICLHGVDWQLADAPPPHPTPPPPPLRVCNLLKSPPAIGPRLETGQHLGCSHIPDQTSLPSEHLSQTGRWLAKLQHSMYYLITRGEFLCKSERRRTLLCYLLQRIVHKNWYAQSAKSIAALSSWDNHPYNQEVMPSSASARSTSVMQMMSLGESYACLSAQKWRRTALRPVVIWWQSVSDGSPKLH